MVTSLLAALVAAVAMGSEFPKPDESAAWIEKCDTNGNGRLTCAEVKDCMGRHVVVRSDEHPCIYEVMTDGDKDGEVCELLPSRVLFGGGVATRLGENEPRTESVRPVVTASYVFGRQSGAGIWPGIMAVLDAELLTESGFLKANGVGVGVTAVFRGVKADDWKQGFGIGLAHMWESVETPGVGEAVAGERTVDSTLLIVTYSFRTKLGGAKNDS